MKRIEDAARVLAQLNDVLERERCILGIFSVHQLSPLNEKKQQLVSRLETYVAKTTPSQRENLKADVLRLRDRAAHNLERLQAMKAAVSEARARLIAALQSKSALGLYDVSGRFVEGPKAISLARSF